MEPDRRRRDRAGLNTRNAAVSGDGKWVMVANYLPHTLVVLDAKDLADEDHSGGECQGDKTSRVSAVTTQRRARASLPR